ncbi:FdhD protein [Paracidovorax wautersii]|uniref:Sulfur carrier protein FdhD n=1 Tax=Paracidovorax wautersii TaxID=1177982 RepID=A0A1I2BP74_9BURK|nr:FdhD protein [Paracidovorax wautersii]
MSAQPAQAPVPVSPLAWALLQALAEEGVDGGGDDVAVSLPRLGKRLGQGVSVLMRQLSLMGEAVIGGMPGPGWVQVREEGGRWTAQLTEAGRAFVAAQAAEADGEAPAPDAEDDADAARALAPLARHTVRVFGEAGLPPEGMERDDILATEIPVALVFNGISHAVMMATPEALDDFALGFALSEGILDRAEDCRGISVHAADGSAAQLPPGVPGVEVHLDISTRCFERLRHRRRSMAGRTGCGVCGVESFAALDLAPERLPARDWIERVDLALVLQAFSQLGARQVHNAQAGALHAAAWAGLDGQLAAVCEDVGRHNALDKLIGHLARAGRLGEPGFVLMSSRGSHELVRKCARVGLGALATISAPTATGVQVAELAGLRLWGLCRAPRGVLYAPGALQQR